MTPQGQVGGRGVVCVQVMALLLWEGSPGPQRACKLHLSSCCGLLKTLRLLGSVGNDV